MQSLKYVGFMGYIEASACLNLKFLDFRLPLHPSCPEKASVCPGVSNSIRGTGTGHEIYVSRLRCTRSVTNRDSIFASEMAIMGRPIGARGKTDPQFVRLQMISFWRLDT
jgi:hypothetical protein